MIQGIKSFVFTTLFAVMPFTSALAQVTNTYLSKNITTATTTLLQSGAGSFRVICINNPVATATYTIYDSLTATGTKLATITIPAAPSVAPACGFYNAAFYTGLTVVTTNTVDATVGWNTP